ncbi:MAG: signal peptidase I [Gammaproteobacteria bacterium]|nr:signal peptidase I [Gammaproteobacteria bacterium]
MNIDFSLVLVCLVGFCGALWLFDILLLKKGRDKAVTDYQHQHKQRNKGKSDDQVREELESLAQEPVVIEYAKSFFPVLLLVLALRSFLVEPFQIPTGSMIPSLLVGDFVLVNKYAYGLRLPVLGTRFVEVDDPKRGEVMVFIHPQEGRYYIKRVVGLPGDTVHYEDKILTINGELVSRELEGNITVSTQIGDLPGTLHSENLAGIEHPIQHINGLGSRRTRTTWIIPGGQYFMMGDNRDNSFDSREWGTVPEENIVGKAIAVWMHKEPGFNLPTFAYNKWIN